MNELDFLSFSFSKLSFSLSLSLNALIFPPIHLLGCLNTCLVSWSSYNTRDSHRLITSLTLTTLDHHNVNRRSYTQCAAGLSGQSSHAMGRSWGSIQCHRLSRCESNSCIPGTFLERSLTKFFRTMSPIDLSSTTRSKPFPATVSRKVAWSQDSCSCPI